jgi:hypothetical protein
VDAGSLQVTDSILVEQSEACEWRATTVSFLLRMHLSNHELVKGLSERLHQILSPMILAKPDPDGGRQDLPTALYNLCDAALNLTLRFRACTTRYRLYRVYHNDTRLSACDMNLISPQSTQGHVSSPLDPTKARIFCTLFGALVKTRLEIFGGSGEDLVLEKAHIIIYEP